MPRVFDIDQALNQNQPFIKFRNKLYKLVDFTVRDKMSMVLQAVQAQQSAEEGIEAKAKRLAEEQERSEDEVLREIYWDEIRPVLVEALNSAVEGLPSDIADTLTNQEWHALQNAILLARESEEQVSVMGSDMSAADLGNLMGSL